MKKLFIAISLLFAINVSKAQCVPPAGFSIVQTSQGFVVRYVKLVNLGFISIPIVLTIPQVFRDRCSAAQGAIKYK